MKNNNIGSVIVVNESKSPLGIVTERDVVNNIAKEGLLYYYKQNT
jgi:predicted transcriptional regulator